jgi:hypothetical protein
MPTSDEEIERTLKQSREISAQIDALAKQALDPAKQIGPLFETFKQHAEQFGEVIQTPGARPGTGERCLGITFELIGDFAEFEGVALEAMDGKQGPKPASSGGARPMRRGMRI